MTYRSYQGFKLTPVLTLIIINIVIFIGYLINSDLLLHLFGLRGTWFLEYPQTIIRQPWTLITSLFVHAGFWHIIANLLTLYYFGTALSQLVGDKKFLMVYFCGGLLGSIFFLLLASPSSIGVGASGAILALAGAVVVMRPRVKVYILPLPVPIPLWVAVIVGFIIISPNIAWQAHLGGVIFGLIAGYFFRRGERRYSWR